MRYAHTKALNTIENNNKSKRKSQHLQVRLRKLHNIFID